MFPFISFLIRSVIGSILLLAGYFKLRAGYQWFNKIVQSYQLPNNNLSSAIAIALPYLEVVLGLLLIIGVQVWWTHIASILLFTVFSIVVWTTYLRGIKVDCGCFGDRFKIAKKNNNVSIVSRNIICSGLLLLNMLIM